MLRYKKKAVFFDFGDTLASTIPPYILRIAAAMRGVGVPVSDREFELAYLRADYELYRRYRERGQITPEEYGALFFPILCQCLLLEQNPSVVRAKIRELLGGRTFGREILEGAAELLGFLKGEGFTLAIISNNDGRTEEKCEEVEIRQYFDLILDSTNLGLTKPDARIFRFALEKLNLAPHEAVHVGDLYGSDVMGARNAGLEAIWLNTRGIPRLNESAITEVKNLIEIKDLLMIKALAVS